MDSGRNIAEIVLLMIVGTALSGSFPGRDIYGILEGRILDKGTGEALIGVNVLVVGTSLGGATDAEGYYRINNLRAGVYDVRYSIVGYKTVIMTDVNILPDLRTHIDVEMQEAAVEFEEIVVVAEKPLIRRDLAATAFSLGDVKLEKLPISSFKEVVALQPGTTLEGNVRGGKVTEVLYLVDGLPVQDVLEGGLGTSLPRSSIAGLTINTGGFDAEYGNAISGIVNLVTKSGTNSHDLIARYERDGWVPEKWNKQQDRASEFELTAGGPVIADNLYYFTANNVTVSDTRWWQDFDRFFRSPISQDLSGLTKLDFVFSPTLRFSLQGIYSWREWRDYEFSWRFNLPGLPDRRRVAGRGAASLTHTLTENTYYTLTASASSIQSRIGLDSKESLSLQPYEYDFFLRYIVTGDRNWWANSRQTIYTGKADLTHHVGRAHLFKFGGEFNQYDIFSDLVKFEPQATYYGKPRVEAPLLNFSNRFNYQPRSGSVYVQDKIEVARGGSNISLGVRWDFLDPTAERPIVEFIPVPSGEYRDTVVGTRKAAAKHQVSPRVSATLPFGPTSFFFVNFGQYFQTPLFTYLYSGITPSQIQGGSRTILSGNPDLDPERVVAWEIGFKQVVNENLVASVTYFRKSFTNQIDSKTLIPFDSKSGGDFGFASYVNNADANASGFEVVLSRERAADFSGSVSYSLMFTEGVSESAEQGIQYAQWGFPVARVAYPLSWDQRHTLKADGEFTLVGGIQANMILLFNTGRPYTYYPTRDGFTPLDSSKDFVPNNKRMANVIMFNAKLTREFRWGERATYGVVFYLDARNILNTRNVRWVDSSGRIGGELSDPGAYYDPRRVRLGFRVEF